MVSTCGSWTGRRTSPWRAWSAPSRWNLPMSPVGPQRSCSCRPSTGSRATTRRTSSPRSPVTIASGSSEAWGRQRSMKPSIRGQAGANSTMSTRLPTSSFRSACPPRGKCRVPSGGPSRRTMRPWRPRPGAPRRRPSPSLGPCSGHSGSPRVLGRWSQRANANGAGAMHLQWSLRARRSEGREDEKLMMGQTRQRWAPLPFLLLLGVVTTAPLGLAPRAEAHANLLRAVPEPNAVLPQPPTQVTLWFSERIALAFSAIQVLDAQGQRVDHDDNAVDQEEATALTVTLPSVPQGLYTVAWKNVSMVDGHRVRGAFVFSVGTPLPRGPVSAPAPPLFQSASAPVLRGLVLLSTLAIAGGVGFALLVSRGLVVGSRPGTPVQHVGLQVVVRTVQHIRIALGVAAVAAVAQLLDHTAVAAERPISQVLGPPLAAVLTGTDWGYCWLARGGLLLLIAVILGGPAAARPSTDDVRGARSPRFLWATVLSCGLLLTLSLTSHGAATLEIRTAAVCADFLHLLAAAG